AEFVHHPQAERQFGANHGQIGLDASGGFEQAVHILQVASQALGFGRDAAVARDAIHLGDARGLAQLPDQRVLATATSQDQDFHRRSRGIEKVRWERGMVSNRRTWWEPPVASEPLESFPVQASRDNRPNENPLLVRAGVLSRIGWLR